MKREKMKWISCEHYNGRTEIAVHAYSGPPSNSEQPGFVDLPWAHFGRRSRDDKRGVIILSREAACELRDRLNEVLRPSCADLELPAEAGARARHAYLAAHPESARAGD